MEKVKLEKSTQFNFNSFYQIHYRRTFLFAKSYVHDAWAAEDIASEALTSLWEIMKKNEIHHPLTFLFSIVKNKSIDYLRHELTHQEAFIRTNITTPLKRKVDKGCYSRYGTT